MSQNANKAASSPLSLGGWAPVGMDFIHELATISGHSKKTLLLLALQIYAGKDGRCFPSRERLANDIQTSLPRVSALLAELKKDGLIWIKKENKRNTYYLKKRLKVQNPVPIIYDSDKPSLEVSSSIGTEYCTYPDKSYPHLEREQVQNPIPIERGQVQNIEPKTCFQVQNPVPIKEHMLKRTDALKEKAGVHVDNSKMRNKKRDERNEEFNVLFSDLQKIDRGFRKGFVRKIYNENGERWIRDQIGQMSDDPSIRSLPCVLWARFKEMGHENERSEVVHGERAGTV